MISNYQTAIKDTNVILNQNISPGLLIIPSKLAILKDPIPGYNNSITTSIINMRFGTNQGLNKVPEPVRKRRSEFVGSSGSTNYNNSWSHRSGLLSKAKNTEGKWTPSGFKKTSTPVQGTGSDEAKKNDYSLSFFIGTFVVGVIGLIAIEVGISKKGVKVRATTN